jgi:hypothetical protein
MHFFLALMLGELCVALTLTLTFAVLCVALTLTFAVLFVAKKIVSTENTDSSEFIDEVFCRRSVVSTKCCVDEVSCRRCVVSTMCRVDKVSCRRCVVSTKCRVGENFSAIICRPNACRQKFFDEQHSYRITVYSCSVFM